MYSDCAHGVPWRWGYTDAEQPVLLTAEPSLHVCHEDVLPGATWGKVKRRSAVCRETLENLRRGSLGAGLPGGSLPALFSAEVGTPSLHHASQVFHQWAVFPPASCYFPRSVHRTYSFASLGGSRATVSSIAVKTE